MLSPAWIQNSFGKKARTWSPRSVVCVPTEAFHSVAEAGLIAAPAIRAAAANQAALLDMLFFSSCIFISLMVRIFGARLTLAAAEGQSKGDAFCIPRLFPPKPADTNALSRRVKSHVYSIYQEASMPGNGRPIRFGVFEVD